MVVNENNWVKINTPPPENVGVWILILEEDSFITYPAHRKKVGKKFYWFAFDIFTKQSKMLPIEDERRITHWMKFVELPKRRK
jgi:hypothetical protein